MKHTNTQDIAQTNLDTPPITMANNTASNVDGSTSSNELHLTHIDQEYAEQEDAKIKFELGSFTGPLDLLLFLVQQHKIDIYDIPIAEITSQYLQYLQEMLVYDLEDITDFYKTAAWLLLIKSRMLLPIHSDIESDDIDTSRNELINTLIEYQKFKKLSDMLLERYEQADYFRMRKESNSLPLDLPKESMWKEVQSMDLFANFMKLMVDPQETNRIIDLNEPVTMNEKIALIYEFLENSEQCSFEEVVAGGSVIAVVCSLLALLELMKQQEVKALQHALNGDIIIVKGSNNANTL